jgi:hydrogenase maturation factor
MNKKEHPTAKQLRATALAMRKYADTFDLMAEQMETQKVSTVFVDNWATAMRGLGYVKNSAISISYEYMHPDSSQAVRELLDAYKSTEKAADEVAGTRPAKKSPKRQG